MKILITGLTGSGKTTLARELAPLIGATVFDGDDIRSLDPNPIGFTHHDRWLHAKRMGGLCDAVVTAGGNAIAAFCCPTHETRRAFNASYVIWCRDIGDRKYADTMTMWRDPGLVDLTTHKGHPPRYWAEIAADVIAPPFRPYAPTALFVGRYQPFHLGHKRLIAAGIQKYGQACIAVRTEHSLWPFERVKQRIDASMQEHRGKYTVISLPNITGVCYGRDVGYAIDHIVLDDRTHDISATRIRAEAALHAADPANWVPPKDGPSTAVTYHASSPSSDCDPAPGELHSVGGERTGEHIQHNGQGSDGDGGGVSWPEAGGQRPDSRASDTAVRNTGVGQEYGDRPVRSGDDYGSRPVCEGKNCRSDPGSRPSNPLPRTVPRYPHEDVIIIHDE